jgi:hypothetical protein
LKLTTRMAALLGAMLLTACAGTQFVRPTDTDLQLGATTETQVRAQLGKPYREANGLTNGKTTHSLGYAYASMGNQPKRAGVTPVHGLELIFHEGKLISKVYMSNLKEDATDFDEAKTPAVQIGKTTAAQIRAMFGAAPGEAMYPAIKQADGHALLYYYQEMRGFTPSSKKMVVVLDAQGTVIDMSYQNSGPWK